MTAQARVRATTAWTVLALLRAATGWVVVGWLVGVVLLVSGGHLHRYQFMSVLSGSMAPSVDVGDLVVARVVTPDQLAAGELVTFREPESGKLVTHRVQSIVWHGELADVVTRGDANEVGENWSVSASDRVGEVVLRVPRVGYAVGVLATPMGQLGLAGVAFALGLWILVVLWRPQRRDEPESSEVTDEAAAPTSTPVPAALTRPRLPRTAGPNLT